MENKQGRQDYAENHLNSSGDPLFDAALEESKMCLQARWPQVDPAIYVLATTLDVALAIVEPNDNQPER